MPHRLLGSRSRPGDAVAAEPAAAIEREFYLNRGIAVDRDSGEPSLLFDAYPFDNSYEVYCNTLWAMTDYTEEMGATRIVPGSHKLGSDRQFDLKDTVPAEMPRGSVLIYSGELYHGGGGNKFFYIYIYIYIYI